MTAYASGTRGTEARVTDNAQIPLGAASARSAPNRWRRWQQPTGAPIGGAISRSAAGIRPSRVPVTNSDISAAMSPIERSPLASVPDEPAERKADELGNTAPVVVQRMCTECAQESDIEPVQAYERRRAALRGALVRTRSSTVPLQRKCACDGDGSDCRCDEKEEPSGAAGPPPKLSRASIGGASPMVRPEAMTNVRQTLSASGAPSIPRFVARWKRSSVPISVRSGSTPVRSRRCPRGL